MHEGNPPKADPTVNRDLLDGYRRGDSWALETLYHAHVQKVAIVVTRGFLFKHGEETRRFFGVRMRYDLEVLVQDVFTRAFSESARQRYDGLRSFESYLFGIARNACIDWVRTNKRLARLHERAAVAAETEPEGQAQTDPHFVVESQELKELLAEFLNSTDARQRTVFERRFHDQGVQEVVARELGLTRIRLRRIEAKLKRDLYDFLRGRGYFNHFRPPASSLLSTETQVGDRPAPVDEEGE